MCFIRLATGAFRFKFVYIHLYLHRTFRSITLKLINNLEYGAGEFSNPDSIPVNVDTEDDIEALIRIR